MSAQANNLDTVSFDDLSSQGYSVIANLAKGSAKVVVPSMVSGRDGYNVRSLFTVGTSTPNGYTPPGILDGIGAYSLDKDTVRLFVNHELGNTAGYPYTVNDSLSLTGARVSYFDINKNTLAVESGGLAYSEIYGYDGQLITNSNQLGIPLLQNGQIVYQGRNSNGTTAGLDRFCSGSMYEANQFGAGMGFADRIYFAPQETTNGVYMPIDVATNKAYLAPALSYGHWENLAVLDTGNPNTVAMVLGNDWSSSPVPLLLYIGTKNASGDGSFLDRNGLASGKLYAWKSYNPNDTNPTDFFGSGTQSAGEFIELPYYDPSKAGTSGYDAYGYALEPTVTNMAIKAGAMTFARIEDLDTNPKKGTELAFAATGQSNLFTLAPSDPVGADPWGKVYTVDVNFNSSGSPTGNLKILYDGDYDPNHALRSPDNLDWSANGYLYAQEDKAYDSGWEKAVTVNPNDGSIVQLDPSVTGGNPTRVAEIDRSSLLPLGVTDTLPTIGDWETSGILDVSSLFGKDSGSLFVFDTQAHGILGEPNQFVEGGQLGLMFAPGVKPYGPPPIDTTKLENVENLTGTDFSDILTGNAGANVLRGLAGSDLLMSGSGNNMLYGDDGNDIFAIGKGGTASIMDFQPGNFVPGENFKMGDRIGLSSGLTYADLSYQPFTVGTSMGTSIFANGQELAKVLGVDIPILSNPLNFVSV